MKHEVLTAEQQRFIKSMYGVGSRDKDAVEALTSYWLITDDLTEKLAAETQRRKVAEAVVDSLSLPNTTPALTKQMAHDYRLLYPKEPAKDSDVLAIPKHLRRGDD